LARKATIVKKIRSEVKNVLLVDAGDLFTRGPYHNIFSYIQSGPGEYGSRLKAG